MKIRITRKKYGESRSLNSNGRTLVFIAFEFKRYQEPVIREEEYEFDSVSFNDDPSTCTLTPTIINHAVTEEKPLPSPMNSEGTASLLVYCTYNEPWHKTLCWGGHLPEFARREQITKVVFLSETGEENTVMVTETEEQWNQFCQKLSEINTQEQGNTDITANVEVDPGLFYSRVISDNT